MTLTREQIEFERENFRVEYNCGYITEGTLAVQLALCDMALSALPTPRTPEQAQGIADLAGKLDAQSSLPVPERAAEANIEGYRQATRYAVHAAECWKELAEATQAWWDACDEADEDPAPGKEEAVNAAKARWKTASGAVADLPVEKASLWRPIADAPKDGTMIICLFDLGGNKWPRALKWRKFCDTHAGWVNDVGDEYRPTHWMPLPAPPTSEEKP